MDLLDCPQRVVSIEGHVNRVPTGEEVIANGFRSRRLIVDDQDSSRRRIGSRRAQLPYHRRPVDRNVQEPETQFHRCNALPQKFAVALFLPLPIRRPGTDAVTREVSVAAR